LTVLKNGEIGTGLEQDILKLFGKAWESETDNL